MNIPRRPGGVLVVDDEDDLRTLVTLQLEAGGYCAFQAQHGAEALDVLEGRDGEIAAVVSDVMMPVMDGPTMARRISERWPSIPVIFMSGYPAETLAESGVLPPEAARIQKPFESREILEAVRKVLSRRG